MLWENLEYDRLQVRVQKNHYVRLAKCMSINGSRTPTNVNDVRSFHGLASFYRRFVPNFGTIAAPLNDIVKKDVVFKWGEAQQNAFNVLKEKLTNAPILALPNLRLSVMLQI